MPYPYNTLVYSGVYDGDMVLGAGYTQPDKAGSFALELVKLYKMTDNRNYLDAAIAIADTLAVHVEPGDHDHSPLPFKVNTITGEVGELRDNAIDQAETAAYAARRVVGRAAYTSNYVGTLELFLALRQLNAGNLSAYGRAFDQILAWMKKYPLRNNRWGPFFEDIPGWSDTQINATTFARFILEHREDFPDWKNEVRGIFDWVYATLGNDEWRAEGVRVVNEQTAYLTPGNSHTSRQAATELLYCSLVDDPARKTNAIRQLSWATYMVDDDGKNCYPRDEVWLTDGYGDYIRHFLRAMAAAPELAPRKSDHLLQSSSVVQFIDYAPETNRFPFPGLPDELLRRVVVHYRTFDRDSAEVLRLRARPAEVEVGRAKLGEGSDPATAGWSWTALSEGGLLRVHHVDNAEVLVLHD